MSDIFPSPAAPLTPGPGGDVNIANAPPSATATQQGAYSQIEATLAQYGFAGTDLAQLSNWAWNEIVSGNSAQQITLDLQQTPQFIARFPAIEARMKAGLPPVSVSQYLSLEDSYEQLERASGIPPNFASYDALIAADVSPSEYSDRITKGYQAVAMADPTVIQAFQAYHGISQGQLAAYFLDPTKSLPLLEQQAIQAQIGGAATMASFRNPGAPAPNAVPTAPNSDLTADQALRLAQMGVTQTQAQQGFQTLSKEQQLYTPLPGQGTVGGPLSTDQLLNAQFGSDGQTQLELSLRAQFEKGTTSEGSGVAQTSGGATGVSNVQR